MVRVNYVGRVTCEARIDNGFDAVAVRLGYKQESEVRSVTVTDALVDTGATTLGLPASILRQLGLDRVVRTKRGRNTTGEYEVKIYGPVRLWLFGRDMLLDAMELADGSAVLIGQLPPEYMQLVVDMANHRLARSPANGGEWVLDMF